jgi:hypothetical protein
MKRLGLFLLAVFMVFSMTECGGGGAVSPGDCPGNVSVTVTSGTAPTFSWTPACLANKFQVVKYVETEVGLGWTTVWSLGFEGTGISPPIVYGVVPSGVEVGTPAQPLLPGNRYRAMVIRLEEPTHFVEEVGHADFNY